MKKISKHADSETLFSFRLAEKAKLQNEVFQIFLHVSNFLGNFGVEKSLEKVTGEKTMTKNPRDSNRGLLGFTRSLASQK